MAEIVFLLVENYVFDRLLADFVRGLGIFGTYPFGVLLSLLAVLRIVVKKVKTKPVVGIILPRPQQQTNRGNED